MTAAAPLLVHLMFHPASAEARALATGIHTALNEDPMVPGLRVATALLTEDGSTLPPAIPDVDASARQAMVLLVDDHMVAGTDAPAGRVAWDTFAVGVARRCAAEGHRFLPIQLSANAWPLHPHFETQNVSFIRMPEEPSRSRGAWLQRRLVIELCRFLLGEAKGEIAPITAFLSHAKHDIEAEPKLLRALVDHLKGTQPIKSWVDSGDIPGGANFADEIERGVATAAVLVLATTNYSSRAWCRREVLAAKKHARPLVVIDGLRGLDRRSFPYLGNVPVVAWDEDATKRDAERSAERSAERAIDLLLKEQLRRLQAEQTLARHAKPGDHIIPAPPELVTLVGLGGPTSVLYPDPPLGDEELELLAPLGHTLTTPLQRVAEHRTLVGKTIGLSISESDSPARYGVLGAHLDAALLELSRHLLVRGASLAYGGHLSDQGYTVALFELVRAHQAMSGLPAPERVISYIGWPLPLSVAERATHGGQARFVRIERPDGIEALEPATFVAEPAEAFPADSPARRFAWARAMTEMRERQTAAIDARIVLGGKVGPTVPKGGTTKAWYSSRIPGVIEEALLTLGAGKPLYVCGGFGGAAAMMAELLEGRAPPEFSWEYQRQAPHSDGMRALYEQQGIAWLDYPEMTSWCRTIGVSGLSKANHLNEAENRELLRTRDTIRIVELILTGLTRAFSGSCNGGKPAP